MQKDYQICIISFLMIIIGKIEYSAGIKDWKRFKKNNETVALNILQVPNDEIKITHAYKSKYNHTRKNQVVLLRLLMVKNGIILL